MGDRSRRRGLLFLPVLLSFLFFLGFPASGQSAHDLSNDGYACHNFEGGQVWAHRWNLEEGR